MRKLRCEEYAYGSAAYTAAVALRQDELRTPLGLHFTPEELAEEAAQRHFGVFDGERLIGSLSMHEVDGGVWKMRQVVIHPDWRGLGAGAALTACAEAAAGAREVVLHARAEVTGFYESLGYRKEGELFMEVGIPHWKMRKRIEGGSGPA